MSICIAWFLPSDLGFTIPLPFFFFNDEFKASTESEGGRGARMEPENVADYNKVEYWDRRYRQEERYDWFSSVYGDTVKALGSLLVSVAKQKLAAASSVPAKSEEAEKAEAACGTSPPKVVCLNVLHLGCGNSALCWDLAEYIHRANMAAAAESPSSVPNLFIQLNQTALDYSQIVIDAMRAADAGELVKRGITTGECAALAPTPPPPTTWVVGDIRQLQAVFPFTATAEDSTLGLPSPSALRDGPMFDVVIDKGTMDALQADKENERMEEDIDEMLLGVSHLLKHTPSGSLANAPWSTFVQVTWETPYYRKHYTMKEEGRFIWDKVSSKLLGESDMYRIFVYTH